MLKILQFIFSDFYTLMGTIAYMLFIYYIVDAVVNKIKSHKKINKRLKEKK